MTTDSEYNRDFFAAWYDAIAIAHEREEQGITANEGSIYRL